MKKLFLITAALALLFNMQAQAPYTPTESNLQARTEFQDAKFGIFIHWGLYAMLATGEWTMTNKNIHYKEYEKLADAFYPHNFNAKEWVDAIKGSGAKYICFTSRHHEGFSMWDTDQSDYNIVDATPYGKDVVRQLADECQRQDIKLHLYYSLIDWWRDDAPRGYPALARGSARRPE